MKSVHRPTLLLQEGQGGSCPPPCPSPPWIRYIYCSSPTFTRPAPRSLILPTPSCSTPPNSPLRHYTHQPLPNPSLPSPPSPSTPLPFHLHPLSPLPTPTPSADTPSSPLLPAPHFPILKRCSHQRVRVYRVCIPATYFCPDFESRRICMDLSGRAGRFRLATPLSCDVIMTS